MGKEEGEKMSIDFGESPTILKEKYMDIYEDVFAEVIAANRFDDNVDLSTTYLGKIGMKREDVMKAEESFPISEQGSVMDKISNGEECQILLDTGASKSYMSKSYYLRCKALHDLPKFTSRTQRIQVGNGQYCTKAQLVIGKELISVPKSDSAMATSHHVDDKIISYLT